MSKAHYETYIVVIGRREGARYAERRPLNVPVDLAVGTLERLSNLQLREALNDLLAEQLRRETTAIKCDGYDPDASQIRRNAS